jgi:tyrosyl-tRNA synthetase
LNLDDEGVVDYLKIFTLLSKEEIENIAQKFEADRAGRIAQKKLAYEVTKLIHGQEAADTQVKIAEALFGGDALDLGDKEFLTLVEEFPVARVPRQVSSDDLLNALVETKLASSKSEARRFFESGAIYINNMQIQSEENFTYELASSHAVIRRGKNTTAVLKIK